MQKKLVQLLLIASLGACSQPWNDPYPAADAESNILYAAFTDRPKHLDLSLIHISEPTRPY